MALMSILELLAAAAAWSAEGTGRGFCSSFGGAGLEDTSPEVVLCGMFLMSLYRDCLFSSAKFFLYTIAKGHRRPYCG